jgi:aminodeoxyfutalosine synthase
VKDIQGKIASGIRLGQADGEALFASADLHALGALADAAKRRRHGDCAYYILNRHINYTNLCSLACEVCGFGKKARGEGVYEKTNEEVAAHAAAAQADGACEVHITGALHPHWRIEHYVDMLGKVRAAAPKVHVKAFTAVEVAHFAALSGITVEETLKRLIGAGLGSMPGGGAEIFDPAVRTRLFPDKIDARQWLEVHRTAHRLGLRTNATMLYGHLETPAHRVAHLLMLRELQDQTGGFQAFVPLSFIPQPENRDSPHFSWTKKEDSPVEKLGVCPLENEKGQSPFFADEKRGQSLQKKGDSPCTTGLDDLKTVAVSRLVLDNFEHIKTFWIMHTLKLSQIALHFGADDIDGTVSRYEIIQGDGGGAVSAAELQRLIREGGLTPVQRDSGYRPA